DNDGNTFWHVKYPPASPVHWVTFDFGELVVVNGLAVLPRAGNVQLWDQDHAIFEGSNNRNDESSWIKISKLPINKTSLDEKGWGWLSYSLPNTAAYRYYRILIDDPGFLSLAEVRLRVKK
ncbi:MAG: discoidin domain-containing protein, partial [Chloroflexi bacterium]|nr:discoidin domain-containing protein [Chloroflexota bacterium]